MAYVFRISERGPNSGRYNAYTKRGIFSYVQNCLPKGLWPNGPPKSDNDELRQLGCLAVRLLPFAREAPVRGRGSTLDHEARSLSQG